MGGNKLQEFTQMLPNPCVSSIGLPNVLMEQIKIIMDLGLETDGPNMNIVNIRRKSMIMRVMSKKRNEKSPALVHQPNKKQSKKRRNYFHYTKTLFSIAQEVNRTLIVMYMIMVTMMKKMMETLISLHMQEIQMLLKRDLEKLFLKLDPG